MKKSKNNIIEIFIALWSGEISKYERLFIAFGIDDKDTKVTLDIINRNSIKWLGDASISNEVIELQFITECLSLTSLNLSKIELLYKKLTAI